MMAQMGMQERTVEKLYRNTTLSRKDFIMGEEVIIIDPRGATGVYRDGLFDVGDIAIVVGFAADCLQVRIAKNQYKIQMKYYRFDKLPGAFRIKDFVMYQDKKVQIGDIRDGKYVVSCLGHELAVSAKELTMVGRKKLI